MRKVAYFIAKIGLMVLAVLIVLLLKQCTPDDDLEMNKPMVDSVLYQIDILPIMQQKCTPCHFPQNGREKLLNTYDPVKVNIQDILRRIQLPVEDIEFMPFKSKKSPLTETEVDLFLEWESQGMPE